MPSLFFSFVVRFLISSFASSTQWFAVFFHLEFPLMFGLILRLLTRGVSWLEFSMGQCTCSSQPHIDSCQAAPSPRKGHASRGRGCATRQRWALKFRYSSHVRNEQRKTKQDNSYHKSIANNMLKSKKLEVCLTRKATHVVTTPFCLLYSFPDDAMPSLHVMYERLPNTSLRLRRYAHFFFDRCDLHAYGVLFCHLPEKWASCQYGRISMTFLYQYQDTYFKITC